MAINISHTLDCTDVLFINETNLSEVGDTCISLASWYRQTMSEVIAEPSACVECGLDCPEHKRCGEGYAFCVPCAAIVTSEW